MVLQRMELKGEHKGNVESGTQFCVQWDWMDTCANGRQEFEAFHPIRDIKRMEEKKISLDLDGDTTNLT